MRWSWELTRYDYRIIYRQGKEAILPDTLSRRDQDMPYGIGNDRLQARFKRLIPEARAHVKGEDPNRSFHRQSPSQFSGKFADLGENRDSSRTLHVETTNLESRIGRQPSPLAVLPTTAVTPSAHPESRVRGKDPDCLSTR